mmetsp:Transcript_18904/g.54163  ORF Transcript_18904/g.54163 Transcript_18904/m.54163 type:complete len:261 (-) Transcript_18904:885-1667(-)
MDLSGSDEILDDSLPVDAVDEDAGRDSCARRGLPRAMDVLHGQVSELREPSPHVGALGVDLLAGIDRVHHEVPSADAGVTTHLPHHRIDRDVGVYQGVIVPCEAVLPTQVQMLDEELCRDVAQVVAHPTHLPQLPHRCVDQREARLAALPAPQCQPRAAPLLVLVVGPDADGVRIGPAEELSVGLVPPDHALREKPAQVEGQSLPATSIDVARREVAEAKVGAEDGGPTLVRAEAAASGVAGVEIRREIAPPGRVLDELL